MEGKTLFLKFNTGPSGHGMPPSAGEAVALKLAGAEEVKVFVVEGEGGLTPGASHETRNTAWGLGLNNLVFLLDWNDYGIDDTGHPRGGPGHPRDLVQRLLLARDRDHGGLGVGPRDARGAGGGAGREPGSGPIGRLVQDPQGARLRQVRQQEPRHPARHELARVLGGAQGVHGAARGRVRGRGRAGADRRRRARGAGPPQLRGGDGRPARRHRRWWTPSATGWSRWRGSCRTSVEGFNLGGHGAEIFSDTRLTDVTAYPPQIWKQPGEKAPNRAALAAWGSWVNAYAKAEYGRPLFIVCSADLADSTNIIGFAKDFGEMPGWGWYNRDTNPRGTLLPQEITEFTNSGVTVGIATVNLADDPMTSFNGFWAACSTYGSFSYLKYGPMRLFSQLAQDSELKLGKVIWVAGHSGPETAEDSRTHFGIFETGVTQLFPEGQVIDLHPWEYNEVPVVLAAALATDVPIIALHLTRPAVEIPDRAALGMASHFEAARGAYLMRDVAPGTRLRRHGLRAGHGDDRQRREGAPRARRRGASTCGSWPASRRSSSVARTRPTGSASAPPRTSGTAWRSRTAPSS